MRSGLSRRKVIEAGVLAAASAALPRCVSFRGSALPPFPTGLPETTPWPEANAILAATRVPAFPAAAFPAGDFGARGDGRTDDTEALQRAIQSCSRAGGGHVMVPQGTFLTGALRLLSNVDLNLAAGARLLFSGDASRYPPVLTRYEGIECVNRSPMIYAWNETNVAITGSGTLDASGCDWNSGSDREGVLEALVARGVPAARRDVVGRLRSSFVQPYRCSQVLIQGVSLVGSRFWQIHPTLCTNVTVVGVTTTVSGANSDGCDPESCDHVVIKRCTLASGDDNLALKSGRDVDGRRLGVPCRNVVVLNCQAEGRFGFITCGSEQSGGIENVYAFNIWSFGQGVRNALWIKSNTRRGGFTRNVNVARFRGSGLSGAVALVTMSYDDQAGEFRPLFDGVHLSDLAVEGAPLVLDLDGLQDDPIGAITVSDSRFTGIDEPVSRIRNAPAVAFRNVTINGRPAR